MWIGRENETNGWNRWVLSRKRESETPLLPWGKVLVTGG